ncbi:MAG: phosphatase [Flavobacteriia bacterium]|nr:phosphatase [Flavobacteriia bacterium]
MKKKLVFLLDIDGVMTTGQFFYTSKGKVAKVFGPHDSDGLKIIKNDIRIEFLTADHRGFLISKKRISEDLGFKIHLVTEEKRLNFIEKNYGLKNVIYMGDGIFDSEILKKVKYGIAPRNARPEAKKNSNFVTKNNSAEGAVLDACLNIKKKFLT